MIKILVLMSTFNGEKYIEEQIKSIFKQKGNFEINLMIRDDGSTDNTINIIKKYQKKYNIIWYSGKNIKPAKSFLDLLYNCNLEYDYYAFSDQDDYWLSNKLSNAIDFLKEDSSIPTVYYSNVELVDKNLKSLGKKLYKKKPYDNIYNVFFIPNYIGCSMVINKKLIEIIRKYERPQIIIMHDSYIVKICKIFNGKILYDNNSYVKYRQHENNVIGSQIGLKEKIKKYYNDIFKKSPITVDEQTKEIIRIYGKDLSNHTLNVLKKVSMYKVDFFSRVFWMLSLKIKYPSLKGAIKYKLEILLGNR